MRHLRIQIFDFRGDLRRLLEYRRDRAIFFFERRLRPRLPCATLSADAISQLDLGIDRGWFGGALSLSADFEAGKGSRFFCRME